MTWVHMLRYDAMIEASLLTAGLVIVIGAAAALLYFVGVRSMSNVKWQMSNGKSARTLAICFLTFNICHLTSGCDPLSQPDEVWLETGTAPGQVVYPRGIAYSPSDDTFFIVDRSAHVQHLDRDGKCLNDWFMPQSQQGKPVGLTVGPDGNLYVPDTHYHRVMVYSPGGKLLKQWGEKGTGPGQFIYPTDIAFDREGNLLVSEYGDNDRIQVFDRDGKYLREFGRFGSGPGEFSRPQSILVDGDYLYVTDACNHRIDVFKTDGTFLRMMGGPGSAPGEYRFPYGLDMDQDGDLIVCEFGNNRVQKIDKQTGRSKATWGGPGREPGRLAYPWGVCVDKRGRIVAVDAGNNRVQVFGF
jgi:DNA-binding beta-propeller fold protein YncE